MKILELGKYYPPYSGGIEIYTQFCAEELAKDHQVECLVFNTGKKTIIDNINNINVIRCSSFGNFSSQELSLSMFWYLWKKKPDVIHFHAPNPLVSLFLLLIKKNALIVVTHHTDIDVKKKFSNIAKWLYNKILIRSVAIIAFTKTYAHSSEELIQFKDKLHIIPHGVDESSLLPNHEIDESIKEIKKNKDKSFFEVFFIGRHVSYKGVDVLLKAIALLDDNVHLKIAGSGPETINYHKLVEKLKIKHKVTFLGNLIGTEKIAPYRTCDVVVLPCITRIESFGIVLVESQLAKKPTITSNIESGVKEVTQDGETGLVFETGNEESLKRAIEKLQHNRALAIEMGEKGYQRAQENYVNHITSVKLRNLFNSLS